MATLFRPAKSCPLPPGAEVVNRKGKLHVRLSDRGRPVYYPLTAAGTAYLRPGPKWAADVRLADGTRKRVYLSPNKEAAAVMLADRIKRVENERAGIVDRYAEHKRRPLADHLEDYRGALVAEGCTAAHADQTAGRVGAILDGCRFVFAGDLSASALSAWLSDQRTAGLSIQTSNHYLTGAKAFLNWMKRDGRIGENPFDHLERGNVDTDRRHERRDLSPEELAELVAATRTARSTRGLAGTDREVLYTVAVMTGLRASELASLTPAAFDLTATTPTVTVLAGHSKRRREDVVPLHPDLVARLRPWLADKAPGCLVWPGKWASNKTAGKMLTVDLATARAAWIAKGATDEEKARRVASSFLASPDAAGRVVDFHALRHTFITRLVKAGVNPKEAQTLARHSTITLTMDRYAHVGLFDAASAMRSLPSLPSAEPDAKPDQLRATGTNGPGVARGVAEGGIRRPQLAPTGPTNTPRLAAEPAADALANVGNSAKDERRGRDSNPRTPCGVSGFQDRGHDPTTTDDGGTSADAHGDGVARGVADGPADPDLARVVAAWSVLPADVRRKVLKLIG